MSGGDGTEALCRLVQALSGAKLVVAAEVTEQGGADPVAASPVMVDLPFDLGRSRILDREWRGVPADASEFRIPSLLSGALGAPATRILYVRAAIIRAPMSGLLLLWSDEPGENGAGDPRLPRADTPILAEPQLPDLAATLAALLESRHRSRRQNALQAQFSDLVDSVPSGIVLVDGDGRTALVNSGAADILGIEPGLHAPSDLVVPMRNVREQCVNRDYLLEAFRALVGNVDYALTTIWDLGDRQIEVDTHPIRGDGEKGRIWLFSDVTVALRGAAELRQLAASDPLTGAPNRRHFEEKAREIIAWRAIGGGSVAIVMIDLDDFKAINDGHGHPAGDGVLREVARRCRETLGSRDVFARLGGDEFVALIPTNDPAEAGEAARRLCVAIAQAPVTAGERPIDVRASLGVAVGQGAETSLEQLIERADGALYAAKHSGRNRVIVAS